jgi:hypothetical protein
MGYISPWHASKTDVEASKSPKATLYSPSFPFSPYSTKLRVFIKTKEQNRWQAITTNDHEVDGDRQIHTPAKSKP